jgi:predicted nucleic acid-binding protein
MTNKEIDSLSHLEIAAMSGCQYFITTDKKILKGRAELEQKFNIKIRTPEEIMVSIKCPRCGAQGEKALKFDRARKDVGTE